MRVGCESLGSSRLSPVTSPTMRSFAHSTSFLFVIAIFFSNLLLLVDARATLDPALQARNNWDCWGGCPLGKKCVSGVCVCADELCPFGTRCINGYCQCPNNICPPPPVCLTCRHQEIYCADTSEPYCCPFNLPVCHFGSCFELDACNNSCLPPQHCNTATRTCVN